VRFDAADRHLRHFMSRNGYISRRSLDRIHHLGGRKVLCIESVDTFNDHAFLQFRVGKYAVGGDASDDEKLQFAVPGDQQSDCGVNAWLASRNGDLHYKRDTPEEAIVVMQIE
jgi:hypothetical protein